MKAFVTGASGFIGQHLIKGLVLDGWTVTTYDRRPSDYDPDVVSVVGDLFDEERLRMALAHAQPDVVFHLAALADVRNAFKQPREQMRYNFKTTFKLLEAMRGVGAKRIAFTSSAVVYGDSHGVVSERTTAPQTSIYGAMKLASESLISAYCVGYGLSADIFRLVSVVGAGYRHGNLWDFYQRLKADPTKLVILGSRTQEKYYVDVHDVVDAMRLTVATLRAGAEVWNVSYARPNTIDDSIAAVSRALNITPTIEQGGDPWAGDLPGLVLDCSKLRAIGWSPLVPVQKGMLETVRDFVARGL